MLVEQKEPTKKIEKKQLSQERKHKNTLVFWKPNEENVSKRRTEQLCQLSLWWKLLYLCALVIAVQGQRKMIYLSGGDSEFR